jgi:hypothetical protein
LPTPNRRKILAGNGCIIFSQFSDNAHRID